jgi:hypothetical protein
MRLAVQNPCFLFEDQDRNFLGFNFAFLLLYQPVIFSPKPGFARRAKWYLQWKLGLLRAGLIPAAFRVVFDATELNRHADVLVCFNGRPDLPYNAPPREFRGLKVWHVLDYVFRATESARALEAGGVDAVLGYADHGRYCPFFQRYYSRYVGRCIPVPFGFGARFANRTPFRDRIPKAVALGSVNPVDDPAVACRDDLADYVRFHAGVRWTHQWRRMLVDHEADLADVMDSYLPHFPKTKDPSYDAPGLLNRYMLFANDEGLMAFPPARTYEGVAAGAVLVCSDHPCYADLGFRDGVNCVVHRRHDLTSFRERLEYYLGRLDELVAIAAAGTALVRGRWTHEGVARHVHAALQTLYAGD